MAPGKTTSEGRLSQESSVAIKGQGRRGREGRKVLHRERELRNSP
jgi:hypothetical protein